MLVDGAALVLLQTIAGVYFLGITGVGAFVFREMTKMRDDLRGLEARYRQLDRLERLMEHAAARSIENEVDDG